MGADREHESCGNESSGNSYAAAPVPPHDRTWRHPSEVGMARQSLISVPAREVGRGVVVVSVSLGVLLVTGLFALSRPHDGDDDPRNILRLTSSDIAVADLALLEMPDGATAAPRAIVIPADGSSMAVTTFDAVADSDSFTVVTADGDTATAEIVYRDSSSSIAVLSITTDESFAVPTDGRFDMGATVAAPETMSGELMALDDSPVRLEVRQSASGQVLQPLDGISDVTEGAPVIDRNGRLVGLCTHRDGALMLVPVGEMDAVLESIDSGR